MPQFCECGRLMNLLTTYQTPVFGSNDRGRMATRKVWKCPECNRERTTDGHGKNVGIKGKVA
jgi:hypothetical protein